MIQRLKHIFKRKEIEPRENQGFSDFFLNASLDEKKRMIKEAAIGANEDQLKVFEAAKNKLRVN
jgi:hypothetical protein